MNTPVKHIVKRVALHEAGHYIAAQELGFTPLSIIIDINIYKKNDGGCDIILHQGISNFDELQDYIYRRVKMLYAGVLAQSLAGDMVRRQEAAAALEKEGIDDASKARELIRVARNIKFPMAINEDVQTGLSEITNTLWEEAITLVEDAGAVITYLSDELRSRFVSEGQSVILTKAEIDEFTFMKERYN